MPDAIPSACRSLSEEVDTLKAEKQSLSEELEEASPGQKPGLTVQIRKLNAQISTKQKALQECISKNTTPVKKNPCTHLAAEVSKLQAALRQEILDEVGPLQEELKRAPASHKPALAKQIKQLSASIRKNSPTAKKLAAKQKEHDKCIVDNGGLLALDATFTGTATMLTSNLDAPGRYVQSVTIGLHFSIWDRAVVTVTSFPAISVSSDTPIVQGTTTVSEIGQSTGTFSRAANAVMLKLSLRFHHDTI